MPESEPSARIPFLEELADSLGQAIVEGGALVHVSPTDEGYDVGLAPLDGQPPADVLVGSVAPHDWTALGVASGAQSRPLDAGAGRARAAGGGKPVEVVVLVDRSGAVASPVRQGGRTFTQPPAWGMTLDCLQRALELPTAPPRVPTGELFAVT